MQLDSRETSAVLAGLRLLQQKDGALPLDIEDVATDGGTHPQPDADWIDELCEKINTAE